MTNRYAEHSICGACPFISHAMQKVVPSVLGDRLRSSEWVATGRVVLMWMTKLQIAGFTAAYDNA